MTSPLAFPTLVSQTFAVNDETFSAVGPIFSFSDGGFMMYPITFCAVMVLVLAGRAALRMNAEHGSDSQLRATIDGNLFWGSYALVLGILGTVVGIAIAAQAVEAVGQVHTQLVWGGIRVSLITTMYGLLVFLGSALVWLALRAWHRRSVLSVSRAA
jgi:biopolymer transport protein ExbB/TolQ